MVALVGRKIKRGHGCHRMFPLFSGALKSPAAPENRGQNFFFLSKSKLKEKEKRYFNRCFNAGAKPILLRGTRIKSINLEVL